MGRVGRGALAVRQVWGQGPWCVSLCPPQLPATPWWPLHGSKVLQEEGQTPGGPRTSHTPEDRGPQAVLPAPSAPSSPPEGPHPWPRIPLSLFHGHRLDLTPGRRTCSTAQPSALGLAWRAPPSWGCDLGPRGPGSPVPAADALGALGSRTPRTLTGSGGSEPAGRARARGPPMRLRCPAEVRPVGTPSPDEGSGRGCSSLAASPPRLGDRQALLQSREPRVSELGGDSDQEAEAGVETSLAGVPSSEGTGPGVPCRGSGGRLSVPLAQRVAPVALSPLPAPTRTGGLHPQARGPRLCTACGSP